MLLFCDKCRSRCALATQKWLNKWNDMNLAECYIYHFALAFEIAFNFKISIHPMLPFDGWKYCARAPISKRNKQTEGKNEQNDDIFVCNHSAVHKRVTHFYSPKTDETKKKNWRKRTKNNAWHNKKIALFVDIFKMFSMLQRPWPKQRHKEHHRD